MPTDLGRVRGSFIFTGNSTTSAQIKAELTAANKIYLDGDIYVVNSSSSHPYFVYNASNTTWEQKGTITGLPPDNPWVQYDLYDNSEVELEDGYLYCFYLDDGYRHPSFGVIPVRSNTFAPYDNGITSPISMSDDYEYILNIYKSGNSMYARVLKRTEGESSSDWQIFTSGYLNVKKLLL